MTPDERKQVLSARKRVGSPWHCPPHNDADGEAQFLVSAACYEHVPIVGSSPPRLEECEQQVLDACRPHSTEIFAWCILPNHYHVLLQTAHIADLLAALGCFHGHSSHRW